MAGNAAKYMSVERGAKAVKTPKRATSLTFRWRLAEREALKAVTSSMGGDLLVGEAACVEQASRMDTCGRKGEGKNLQAIIRAPSPFVNALLRQKYIINYIMQSIIKKKSFK
jgi:hypothetical protein